MPLVRFRCEGFSVELCGLSSGSVSLGRTPRAEPPHATSAPLPSPSDKQQHKSQNTENLTFKTDHATTIPTYMSVATVW